MYGLLFFRLIPLDKLRPNLKYRRAVKQFKCGPFFFPPPLLNEVAISMQTLSERGRVVSHISFKATSLTANLPRSKALALLTAQRPPFFLHTYQARQEFTPSLAASSL